MRQILSILTFSSLVLQGCGESTPEAAGDQGAIRAAALAGVTSGPATEGTDTTPVVVRRVWHYADGLQFWGGPSPDGRYLSYVDWWTGDLAIHDFVSGEDRHLTDEGSLDDSKFAVMSSFAPDGEQVAYSWENGAYDELRIQRVDEPVYRVVYSDSSMNIHPREWSADGHLILVNIDRFHAREGEPRGELGLVSVEDGSLDILKSFVGQGTFGTGLSPDGRFVIYDSPSEGEPPNRDVFLIDVAGGREEVLVDHPANDLVLGWAPDGGSILFSSDRTGTQAAWLLPVSEGEPAGEPLLVKPELWRIRPLGFARDGSFFYGVNLDLSTAYVATIHRESGALLEAPTRLALGNHGGYSTGEWSPDGRFLALISKGYLGQGDRIVIRSSETGDTREVRPALRNLYWPNWSPNGQSLLVWASDDTGEGLFLVDVQTAQDRALFRPAPDEGRLKAEWDAAGGHLFVHTFGQDGRRIGIRDPSTGSERVLVNVSHDDGMISAYFGVSPGGRSVAFFRRGADGAFLEVMSVPDGQARPLMEVFPDEPHPSMIEWGPDGEYIYYQRMGGSRNAELSGFWRVPTAGGAPERLAWNDADDCILTSIHPSGNRVALECREGEGGDEVWVMEDFLPTPEESESGRRVP